MNLDPSAAVLLSTPQSAITAASAKSANVAKRNVFNVDATLVLRKYHDGVRRDLDDTTVVHSVLWNVFGSNIGRKEIAIVVRIANPVAVEADFPNTIAR